MESYHALWMLQELKLATFVAGLLALAWASLLDKAILG
jgi:hypothetical protein